MTLGLACGRAALGLLLQCQGSVPDRDPYAGDPYREDLTYRSEVDKAAGFLETGELKENGRRLLQELLERYPASPLLHYESGCQLAGDKKWDEAAKAWEEAVFADDGKSAVTVRALEGIAQAEKQRRRKEGEIRALERLAKAMPLSYRFQNRLAEAYQASGQADKARGAWKRSLELNTGQPELARRIGGTSPVSQDGRKEELTALLSRLTPSIVLLEAGDSRLTGFVALGKGCIVTAAHGFAADDAEVDVVCFVDAKAPRRLKGKVMARDEKRDLALVQCADLPQQSKPLPLAAIQRLEAGTRIYTLGNPGLGSEALTLTPSEGIVADCARKLEGQIFIQCNLSVNPGNSGGPLFTARGEVVGIVTRKASLEGVSFSVPAAELAEMLSDPGPLHAPLPDGR